MKYLIFLLTLLLFACQSTKNLDYKHPSRLFNGNNLSGWHWDVPEMDKNPEAINPFFVRDGMLVTKGEPGGHLITDINISNYKISFEYRFAGKPGNCGALVHVSKPRRLYAMFPQSVEVQLMHDNAGDFWCIGENIEVPNMEARRGPKEKWGVDGDKNRRIPNLTDDTEKPVGQWNQMQIECFGGEVKVWLNGIMVNHGFNATATSGAFALQSEGSEVEFKNIYYVPIKGISKNLPKFYTGN